MAPFLPLLRLWPLVRLLLHPVLYTSLQRPGAQMQPLPPCSRVSQVDVNYE